MFGVCLGIVAFAAPRLVILPAHLWRVHRRRNGRFSIFLLLYAGSFFLPSIPSLLLTLAEIGNLVAVPGSDIQFGK